MLHTETNMHSWKKEQIQYFKKYLNSFEENSREYKLLKKGIEELEGQN